MRLEDEPDAAAGLEKRHTLLAERFGQATPGLLPKLKEQAARLEAEIAGLRPQTITLSERLGEMWEADRERRAGMKRVLKDYATLPGVEKGAALRSIFEKVVLYWDATWHPARVRKMAADPDMKPHTEQGGDRRSEGFQVADRHLKPASSRTRLRKTDRKGRYSYPLLHDQIDWQLTGSHLKSSRSSALEMGMLLGLLKPAA
jgi:hypothetical protein